MATFYKREGARGIRWTARVRFAGREITKTWGTKAAAESWARSQETAIEGGEFKRLAVGVIFADLVDALLEHRKVIRRPLGKTAANAIERLKLQHGLEAVDALTEEFWRKTSSPAWPARAALGRVPSRSRHKPPPRTSYTPRRSCATPPTAASTCPGRAGAGPGKAQRPRQPPRHVARQDGPLAPVVWGANSAGG